MTTGLSDAGVMFADGSYMASAKELAHFNDIVNGDFRIAQAGISFAATAHNAYDLDGWATGKGGGAVFTVAQVAGSTAGRLARQATVTTASAVAAGDFVFDATYVEGYNIEKYVGNTFTIGFRAKVPVAGIHCVALRNLSNDRSYVAEINFPTANVVQNCSFTVVGGLPTAGTWNYLNNVGLFISFTHACGSTFQTTPNAWNTGNFLGTANQVNDCATVGNAWALEKVTMNLGTVAAVGEISFEQELIRCQRYFCKTFNQGVAPAFGAGFSGCLGTTSGAALAGAAEATWGFPVEMCRSPTVLTFNPVSANTDWRNANDALDVAAFAVVGTRQVSVSINGVPGASRIHRIHITASARL